MRVISPRSLLRLAKKIFQHNMLSEHLQTNFFAILRIKQMKDFISQVHILTRATIEFPRVGNKLQFQMDKISFIDRELFSSSQPTYT